jgi:hypothetical protein
LRLDFNVLWVDDQPDRVAAQIRSITAHMATEGFDFRPTQCTTIGDVEAAVAEHVFADEVDLILVDWDLGNGVYGEDVIERIRDAIQYKDVVFYSAQTPVIQLRQKAYERSLEGIYCASREGLVDEVVGVFDSLIKKVLDLDHTRGIVMGATSDIDHIVNTCLIIAHDKLDSAGKRTFLDQALRRARDKIRNLAKQEERLRANPSVDAALKAHMLLTADDRLRMLSRILEMDAFSKQSGGRAAIEAYRGQVVARRNTLGHAVLVPRGKAESVVNEGGRVVDINEMRELRKLILSLRADFRSLLDAMQA